MSEYKLSEGIINLSNAQTWDEAKLEWVLAEIFKEDIPETCLCGHFPINEICVLRNKFNNNVTIVGNCCVKKFIGLPSDKIFTSIKKVSNDISAALNMETIVHSHEKKWITTWEKDFYVNTWRKRILSAKQLDIRTRINQKVLNNVNNKFRRRKA